MIAKLINKIYLDDPRRFWIMFWFVLSFISIVGAYSAWPYLWKGAFYQLLALGLVSIWRHVYLKSTGTWSIAYFVTWLISCNNLADELFFDNSKMDWNEWTGFLLIVFITLVQRKRWKR